MRRHSLSPSGPSHPPQDDLKAAGLSQQVSTNVLREPIVAGLHGAGSYPQSRRAHPLAGCLAALWGHAVWRARLLSGVGAAAIRLDLGLCPAQRGAAIRLSRGCTVPCGETTRASQPRRMRMRQRRYSQPPALHLRRGRSVLSMNGLHMRWHSRRPHPLLPALTADPPTRRSDHHSFSQRTLTGCQADLRIQGRHSTHHDAL